MRRSERATIAAGILVIITGVFWAIGMKYQLNQHFNGPVQSVRANFIGRMVVKINNVEYTLALQETNYTGKTDNIKPGDFLIKNKGSMQLKWVKRGSRDTVRFFSVR